MHFPAAKIVHKWDSETKKIFFLKKNILEAPLNLWNIVFLNSLILCRPPTSGFDSVLRSRYFPGGPTPDGLESDIMFKNLGDNDHFTERQNRRESEDMITDNRFVNFLGKGSFRKKKYVIFNTGRGICPFHTLFWLRQQP